MTTPLAAVQPAIYALARRWRERSVSRRHHPAPTTPAMHPVAATPSDDAEPARREADRDLRHGATLRVERVGDAVAAADRPLDRRGRHSRDRDRGVLRNVWDAMMAGDALNVAGGMAYFAFLSLPPTILVLFALTGFFGGEEVAAWVTQQLSAILPEEAAEWIDRFVESVVLTRAPGPFSIGLALALWAASNVFMAVMRALNIAYGVEETRSFIHARALALGVMLLFVVFFLLGSASLIAGPYIARALGLEGVVERVWGIVQWVLPFVLILGAFWMAYFILPARDRRRRNRAILIGALAATVIWALATLAFRVYVGNFGNYDEVYGVLGGVIILLLWLYMTMLVILFGGQLAAELERRARA